jgi:hypothetical protein
MKLTPAFMHNNGRQEHLKIQWKERIHYREDNNQITVFLLSVGVEVGRQ